MRLGVLKELRPRLVATFTEKAGSCEGTGPPGSEISDYAH